jgi:multiple sugar transport system substrate-binding protein
MAIERTTGGDTSPQQARLYTRRGFLKLAGAAGLALSLGGGLSELLAACGGDSATEASAGGSRIQLVYQDWSTQGFPPMAQTELARFQAEHPGISVFYTPDPDNAMEQMPLDMQAGNAADVFQGTCEFFPSWAEKGYVLDLREYVKRDVDPSVIADWDPAQYQALFDAAGHEFGVPKYQGTLVLYYNKDLFDASGVPYPTSAWNHDDYLSAMKQLTRDTDNDGRTDVWGSMIDINWDRLQVHINAWGGHVVDPADRTRCVIDSPESLAALEWVRARMWDDKVMATFTDVNNIGTQLAFSQGKLAMVEDGSWGLKNILERADFRVGVAPLPAGPARRATLSTSDGFGIYSGTRHPEAAWELVKFLISEEYALAMAKANLLQPSRLSLVARWEEFVKEQYPKESAELELDAFAAPHREGYSVVQEIFPQGMAQATSLLREAFTEIFTLGHAGLDTLGDVSREIGKVVQTGPVK